MYPESYKSSTNAEVFALQVREDTVDDIVQWTGGEKVDLSLKKVDRLLTHLGVRVETPVGPRIAHKGQWVVQYKSQSRYFYVVGKAEFDVVYTNI